MYISPSLSPRLRHTLNEEASQPMVTLTSLLVKATALASQAVPECNSAWAHTAIRTYTHVHVCVSVPTPAGLVAPVVTAVETKVCACVCVCVW